MQEKRIMNARPSRRLLPAIIIAAVMVLTAAAVLMPATETDAVTKEYVDMYGDLQTSPDVTTLANAGDFAALAYTLTGSGAGGTWYYVSLDVDLGANVLTITGTTVNLIIGTGKVLSVQNGVNVTTNTTFNLYTEDPSTFGMGTLDVYGGGNGVTLQTATNAHPFTNSAKLYASVPTSNAVVSSVPVGDVMIYNAGIISGGKMGISVRNALIENRGTITGGENGIESTYQLNLNNYTGGSISGTAGSGVYLKGDGYYEAVRNYGIIEGSDAGVRSDYKASVSNNENGSITGNNFGVYIGWGEVINYGTIEGLDLDGIFCNADLDVRNEAAGASILGNVHGINSLSVILTNFGTVYGETGKGVWASGEVYNNDGGKITGAVHGVHSPGDLALHNYQGGEIKALAGGDEAIRISNTGSIYNEGLISGPTGIYIGGMAIGDEIYNTETGEIYGSAGDGISIWGGDGCCIINDGGYIYGSNYGVYINTSGEVFNYISASGATGYITGGNEDGVYLGAGGRVYNAGGIAGDNGIWSANSAIILEQLGAISGDVTLCNAAANTVTFGAGSVIEGDFNIGSDPGSTLTFVKGIGTTLGLIYAHITGVADIGNATAAVADIRNLPAGYAGADVTLIHAMGGVVGSPANDSVLPTGLGFPLDLWIEGNNKLMAGGTPSTSYKITATADSGSTITPSGICSVSPASDKTFAFSAKPGYIISEVKIDNAFSLTQAEVDSGSYTFTRVMADHTISVKSLPGTSSNITLTIIVKEGNGYAEYNTGSGFVKYTGAIALTAGTNVQLRAVADDGFVFDKWETPGVETNQTIAINNIQSSKSVNLYFAAEDSGNPSSSVIWYVFLLILILLVIFVIYYIWKRSKNKS